jgi:hypothetical protein
LLKNLYALLYFIGLKLTKRGLCGPSCFSLCMLGACRLDVVLCINENYYMFMKYNLREGIDNIVEFIVLWDLLEIVIKNDIINLSVERKT